MVPRTVNDLWPGYVRTQILVSGAGDSVTWGKGMSQWPWHRTCLQTALGSVLSQDTPEQGSQASPQDKHTDFSRQCSRRIKRQEHRWCVVMWIFPQLWEEIRSCVPVTATGSSPSQSTSIQKKILLSNEKINLNMCIRHLCFVTCAIFLYFH